MKKSQVFIILHKPIPKFKLYYEIMSPCCSPTSWDWKGGGWHFESIMWVHSQNGFQGNYSLTKSYGEFRNMDTLIPATSCRQHHSRRTQEMKSTSMFFKRTLRTRNVIGGPEAFWKWRKNKGGKNSFLFKMSILELIIRLNNSWAS